MMKRSQSANALGGTLQQDSDRRAFLGNTFYGKEARRETQKKVPPSPKPVSKPVNVDEIRFTQDSISLKFSSDKVGGMVDLYRALVSKSIQVQKFTKSKRLQCIMVNGIYYCCNNRRLCALKEYSRYLKKRGGEPVMVWIDLVTNCGHPITCRFKDCEVTRVREGGPNERCPGSPSVSSSASDASLHESHAPSKYSDYSLHSSFAPSSRSSSASPR